MAGELPLSQQIYRVQSPSKWPDPPAKYSFSSLSAIEICPLQYQLSKATFEGFGRFPQRSHPATVAGQIVHEILDRLFKCLAFQGLPEMGSDLFSKTMLAFNLVGQVSEEIRKAEVISRPNPRVGADLTGRLSAADLANKVVRHFRPEYEKAMAGEKRPTPIPPNAGGKADDGVDRLALLRQLGVLTEIKMKHPKLPFRGIIDLIRNECENTILADFKTGKRKQEHALQLKYYAVLWWRETGQRPSRLELCYPDGSQVVSYQPSELESIEAQLKERINSAKKILKPQSAPAEARLSEDCCYCEPRAYCEKYWKNRRNSPLHGRGKAKPKEKLDIELSVSSPASETSLCLVGDKNREVPLIYPSGSQNVFGPFEFEQRLRLLNSYVSQDGKALELKSWSEAYRV